MHYLAGIIHTAEFSDFFAMTTWSNTASEARHEVARMKALGAHFAKSFKDGKGYRIAGHFKKVGQS